MDYAIPYLVEVFIVSTKGNEVVNVFNKYNMESSKRISPSNTNLIVDILGLVCTSLYSILSVGSVKFTFH
jgi:hypothetical protein